MSGVSDFLLDLVATPSVSSSESRAVRRFIEEAAALGFEAEIDEAGNGIARRGRKSDSGAQIVLLGHIDTVPGDIPVRVEDGVLHGRGSVDAKGPLAALLYGAAACGLDGESELVVVAAVGEETSSSPGAHFVRDQLRPDACIIGEPSGWDGVTLGYKGRLITEVLLERPVSHTSGPEGSACDALLAWWRELDREIGSLTGADLPVFDRVQTTIHGMSSDGDGLSETATLRLGFRLPESVGPDALSGFIDERLIDGMSGSFRGGERAHRVDRSDPVARSLSAAIRGEGGRPRPKVKTGTADLNVVAPVWDCPIAAYGPGDSSLDHTPDERIELAEVERSAQVVARSLEHLLEELTATSRSVCGAGAGGPGLRPGS